MKKAIIYVRGHNQEMQEIICRLYATEKKYSVRFVTTDFEKVNNCDILIVANPSRISRDKFEYHEKIKLLKNKGITVEYADSRGNIVEMPNYSYMVLNR